MLGDAWVGKKFPRFFEPLILRVWLGAACKGMGPLLKDRQLEALSKGQVLQPADS